MEYIAFKALKRDGDTLCSPSLCTPWLYDLQGRPCLVADSMDDYHGVYAATWKEAAKYGEEIYMVVPYLLDGGDPEIALGTSGWRSSAATVIAGPWRRNSKKGMRLAAEFVLASHTQGYRQVEGILLWAAGQVGLPALHILEQAIDDDDPNVRAEAVTAAGQVGLPALHILEQAIGDNSLDVRWWAVLAAGQVGLPALHILEQAMGDDDLNVRLRAVIAADRIGLPALHILEQAIGDDDTDVRAEAVTAAGQVGLPALHILERAMGDDAPIIRRQAVYEAGQMGLPALHILEQAMGDDDPDVRLQAVLAASQIGSPALHILELAMGDDDTEVRWRAVLALPALPRRPAQGPQPATPEPVTVPSRSQPSGK